jgi:hypothetical protein
MTPLLACPSCARHVQASEAACPFCRASVVEAAKVFVPRQRPAERLSRAARYAFGVGSLAVGTGGCSGLLGASAYPGATDATVSSEAAFPMDARDAGKSAADVTLVEDVFIAASYGLPGWIDAFVANVPDTGADGGLSHDATLPIADATSPNDASHDGIAPTDASPDAS